VITPRQTRLLRVPDLQSFQRVLAAIAGRMDVARSPSCAFLVPSQAAAGQLRYTLQTMALGGGEVSPGNVSPPLPDLVTRQDWYDRLYERLGTGVPRLSEFEREVMMSAAARAASDSGTRPPFRLRAGLIVEVVRLYDGLRRLQKTVDDFERLLIQDLETDAESDRGAERLLLQTRFLVGTFRRYEHRLAELHRLDEHLLRQWLLDHPLRLPYTHVVIAVADCVAEREGLWPADFDLLTRLPLLTGIDVVATEESLAAGFHDRVRHLLPGIAEEGVAAAPSIPTLLAPAVEAGELYFRSRDREDELSAIVRRLKSADGGESLGRTAVVFKRPLPYLYLAGEVFGSAAVPYQTFDALPLAAEPYAAALDLIFDCVSSGFSRASIVALLRSPHFSFNAGEERFDRRAVALFDLKLADAAYLGDLERLRTLVGQWPRGDAHAPSSPNDVAAAALAIADELEPLLRAAPASHHLVTLWKFLQAHEQPVSSDDPFRERQLRGRAAIHAAIEALREAHTRIDDGEVEFGEVTGSLRRWIEGQTFAPRTGSVGVHLVDAEAARFGWFDDVHVVGLVDTDWPDRAPRNIFFPPFLLQQHFRWPAEADRLTATRGAFRDLLCLARRRVSLSTFGLEDEAIVGPSVFLEDLDGVGLDVARVTTSDPPRAFPYEAASGGPIADLPLSPSARRWLLLRHSRSDMSASMFHGQAGAHERRSYAVGALETYLECPFRFFAKHVLGLDDEPQDEEARRPRLQGIFLHNVFQVFFEEWGRRGHRAITLEKLADARDVFAQVVEPLLGNLPAAEAALERNRLFGSAAAEGLAEVVFRIEAEWGVGVIERLLEHRLEGEFEMQGAAGPQRIGLTGIADRIDLLEDGTLRVIDYKSGRPPSAKRMLQLPVYSVCASQQLEGRHGRSWTVGDGGYIAFKDARRFVPLADRGNLDHVLQEAQARLLNAIDKIEAGEFPPDPLEPFRCTFCSFSGVCRKDYVGDE